MTIKPHRLFFVRCLRQGCVAFFLGLFVSHVPVVQVARAESATEMFAQAYEASQRQDYSEAERLYKSGLELGKTPPDVAGLAHYYLAEALRKQNKTDADTLYHYKQAARLIPQTEQGQDALIRVEVLTNVARQDSPPQDTSGSIERRPSTFQKSCTKIHYVEHRGQAALVATCRTIAQDLRSSRLILQGISNENGRLKQGAGESSFHRSCTGVKISARGNNVTLAARCRKVDGTWIQATLSLRGIENRDGHLGY